MGSNKSIIKDFASGIGYFFKGFALLISRPRLWPWAIIPTILNLIILIVMFVAFIHYYGDLYAWLSSFLGHIDIENPATWYMHLLDGLLWVVDLVFQILIVLLTLVLLLIISYVLSLIIAGPFNDALSEQVEIMVTGSGDIPFSLKKFIKDLWRIIKMESIKALILLLIPIVLFVLNFIPAVGGFLYVLLTFLFGAWDLGFAFAELPLGRKLVPLKERFAFGMKHKWALMGLGSGFIIPFFYLIFAAPLAVGGTLLYLDRSEPRVVS